MVSNRNRSASADGKANIEQVFLLGVNFPDHRFLFVGNP
jgi:hypothetical protein